MSDEHFLDTFYFDSDGWLNKFSIAFFVLFMTSMTWPHALQNRFHILFKLLFLQEGNPEQRNLDDGAALAKKVAKKAAIKEEEEDLALKATSLKNNARKKVSKQADTNLDDLLSAGLKKTKKK